MFVFVVMLASVTGATGLVTLTTDTHGDIIGRNVTLTCHVDPLKDVVYWASSRYYKHQLVAACTYLNDNCSPLSFTKYKFHSDYKNMNFFLQIEQLTWDDLTNYTCMQGLGLNVEDMATISLFLEFDTTFPTLWTVIMLFQVLVLILAIIILVVRRRRQNIRHKIGNERLSCIKSNLISNDNPCNSDDPVNIHVTQKCPSRKYNLTKLLACIKPNKNASEIQPQETKEDSTPPTCQFRKNVDVTLRRNDVNILHSTMKSVGILFTKNGGKGTVVRIGECYVITAWHVIKDIVLPITSRFNNRVINPSFLKDTDIYTDFHECCRQSPNNMRFGLKPLIVLRDTALDIVILELDCIGKEEFIPPPISLFADVFTLNSHINQVPYVLIIGQHPTSDTVVIDPGCKIITRDDTNVKKSRDWLKKNVSRLKKLAKAQGEDPTLIDRAYYDVFDVGSRLIFDTYLGFGGSGGAVIAIMPEGGIALVAILTHGIPASLYTTFSYPDFMRMEVGSTIKAIKESNAWEDDITKSMIRDMLFCADNNRQPMETENASYHILDETNDYVIEATMDKIMEGITSLAIDAE